MQAGDGRIGDDDGARPLQQRANMLAGAIDQARADQHRVGALAQADIYGAGGARAEGDRAGHEAASSLGARARKAARMAFTVAEWGVSMESTVMSAKA